MNSETFEVAAQSVEPKDRASIRASMKFNAAHAVKTNPVIVAGVLIIGFVLYDRVAPTNLLLWAGMVISIAVWREFQAMFIYRRVSEAPLDQVKRYDRWELVSAAFGSHAVGSVFWLVAWHSDIYIQLLISMFYIVYVMGGVVHAAPNVSGPFLRASGAIHGFLFWLIVALKDTSHWAELVIYCSFVLIGYWYARAHVRQFRESLAIRDANAALLLQSEADRKLIESALREATIANESKSRFLAAASHDLRQPLHALTMFLGTLSFHVAGEEAGRLLARIKETVQILEEQFNSLLDLSRFDVGAVGVEIKPFRLDQLAERTVGEMRAIAAEKNLELLSIVCPAIAKSDPILIGRLLRNLLDNALKYTETGTITVRVTDCTKNFLVEVIDTGPGIPLEQQQRIFDEYVQLGNPGRQRQRGVGLGLAIVKRIGDLLDLDLKVKSDGIKGSEFSFLVPASEAIDEHVQQSTLKVNRTSFGTSASIWILDDDSIALEALQEQLSIWGARVVAFSNPEDLLATLRNENSPPDWIFTDDMLGSPLSGLEIAQTLSREFGFQNTCVITGNTEPLRMRELRSSGFGVIVKPAKAENLIAVIEGERSTV